MITALVVASLAALLGLALPRLLRPTPPPCAGEDGGSGHPESMTAELDPWDEEYLAWLADALWPEDEYLEPERSPDGEGEAGGSVCR
ncbi:MULTISPECIES: hypothetical protein [Thermomonosporaceae]|uniref:hypothetical protein n=1 Tax=Thermomonosporaceae TaxID=2012 RepID=UPI00255AFCE2|nr:MULTISPECIES: hypothetical protein [Thermomonosporaceae]MDL4774515.1 hypothetical protein [Actinomadura xylanilytica]